MFKRIGLALLLTLWSSLAFAQGNPTCPTRPSNDSSNACASTAFVKNSGSIFPPATPVTRATLQAAINAAEAAGGGTVQIPGGIWSIDTTAGCISITSSVIVQGVGAAADSAGGGTILNKTNASNDLFCVTAAGFGAIEFRNFGVTTAIAQNASTAGIHIISATVVTPINIDNLTLNALYNGVQIDNGPQFYINNNLITSFTGNGIVVAQPNSADAGVSVIADNKIWDTGGTAGGNAGILWNSGSGLRIHNNRILGAFKYGIFIDLTNTFGDDGALLISQNMIEVQKLYGIYMKREAGAATAGTKIGQITIIGNHIQGLDAGYQNHIGIESSTPSGWVQGATITGNIFQNARDDLLNNAVIRVDDGTGITVDANTIINIGATGGGLRAGPNSTNVIFSHNNNIGASASVRYPTTQTTTTIIDLTGLPFANLPTAKNGSQIYATDGTQGTPITGASTGALAYRVNGVWNGLSGTTVTPTTATTNQFFNSLSAGGLFGSAQPAFSGISGSVGCSQLPALTGDVTTSGCAATIAAQAVTTSKIANVGANSVLSNWTSGTTSLAVNTWPACAADGGHALTYTNGTGVLCTATKVSSFTKVTSYNLTTASGTQALTGFGFQPSTCTSTGSTSAVAQYTTLFGTSDSALHQYSTSYFAGAATPSANFLVAADTTGTNYQFGTITSYDADGLTITWAKTGSPTGTFNYAVTCLK